MEKECRKTSKEDKQDKQPLKEEMKQQKNLTEGEVKVEDTEKGIMTKEKLNKLVHSIVQENNKLEEKKQTILKKRTQNTHNIQNITTQEQIESLSDMIDRITPGYIYRNNHSVSMELKTRKHLYWVEKGQRNIFQSMNSLVAESHSNIKSTQTTAEYVTSEGTQTDKIEMVNIDNINEKDMATHLHGSKIEKTMNYGSLKCWKTHNNIHHTTNDMKSLRKRIITRLAHGRYKMVKPGGKPMTKTKQRNLIWLEGNNVAPLWPL